MGQFKEDKYRIKVAKAGWFYVQKKCLIFWITKTEAWSGEEIPITHLTLQSAERWIQREKFNKVEVAENRQLLNGKIF